MDDEIGALVRRLARPHPTLGHVVERSALLAAGGDYEAIVAWITARGGRAEPLAAAEHQGLHGSRRGHGPVRADPTPTRFVMPPGSLA